MIANATAVPPRIQALVKAAGNRPRPVRPAAAVAPPSTPRADAAQMAANPAQPPTQPPKTADKRPIPVRIVALVAMRVYSFSMRLALAFRWIATSAVAFQGWFAKRYWQATQFIRAHIQGVVTGRVADERRAVCDGCGSKATKSDGHPRCAAMDCGCSTRKWWFFTWLAWLRWLVGWDCPRHLWGGEAADG